MSNIRGRLNSHLDITNDDVNMTYDTFTGNTVTANNTLYVNGIDVEVELNNKQDIIDTDTNITCNSLLIENEPATLNFNNAGEIKYTTASNLMTFTCNADVSLTLDQTNLEANFQDYEIQSQYININNGVIATRNNYDDRISFSTSGVNTKPPGDDLSVMAGIWNSMNCSSINHTLPDVINSGINESGEPSVILVSNSAGNNKASYNFQKYNNGTRTGRIEYDFSANTIDFNVNNASRMTLSTSALDMQGNDITNIGSAALNEIDADELIVGTDSTQHQIDLTNDNTNHHSEIFFRDNGVDQGGIRYDVASNRMDFYTGGNVLEADYHLRLSNLYVLCGKNLNAQSGLTVSSSCDIITDTSITGKLTCDSLVYGVEVTNKDIEILSGKLSVGGSSPVSSVVVQGSIEADSTISTEGIHMGKDSSTNYGIQFSQPVGSGRKPFIKFSDEDVSFDGKIEYDLSTDELSLWTVGDKQLSLTNGDADFESCKIHTIGDLEINTDKFFVNATTGFVGIGTKTQEHSELFHVQGDICCDSLCVNGTDGVITSNQFTSSATYLDLATSDAYNGDYTVRIEKTALGNGRGGKITTQNALELVGSATEHVYVTGGNFIVDTDVLYCDITNNRVGINNASPSVALDVTGAIKSSGNLTINTDKFSVNSSTGFVGIGTNTQQHSELLHVQGSICCDGLCVSGTDGVISDRQFTSASTFLDLTTSDAYNGDYTLRIWKTALGNARGAKLDSQGDIELAGGGTVRVSKNFVVESGNTVDANLNSTRGQLISFMGEENGPLNASGSNFDFNYGNGAVSGSQFGMMIPCKVKLKRFCYGATGTGTNYTTSTRIVFRLHVDGVVQNVYAYCDFSDTTNGSITYRRFSNKFSSSSTSQIDTEPTFSNTYGQTLAWQTVTLTAYNTDVNKHRFSVVVETTENL